MTNASGAAFDPHARRYDQELNRGLAVTGEGRDFFARGRVDFLARCLRRIPFDAANLMDFGCGTGTTASLLLSLPGAASLVGVDVSPESIAAALDCKPTAAASFEVLADHEPAGHVDLAYSNGVFHHIPRAERAAAVDHLWRSLRPGGLFALWENNPWNPGARYVMSRIPFDRDAIMLSAPEARRLLRERGFEILRTDFLFIFPRVLAWLRPLERLVTRLPLGAQYQVLARRPERSPP